MDFPYGELLTRPPEGFMPPEAWPEYGSIAAPPVFCKREVLNRDPAHIRWGIWPIYFERYTGDIEPDTHKSFGLLTFNRVVLWHRIGLSDTPIGWKAASTPRRIDGFYDFRKDSNYLGHWSRIAKRHLRDWQISAPLYNLEPITLEEYAAAYKASTVAKKVSSEGLAQFIRKCLLPEVAAQIQLWGVRNRKTKVVVAGLASHYSKTYNSSVHELPFVNIEGAQVHAMVGLIDHWFAESLQRGVAIQLMTYFWFPGQPKKWRGFSEFKSHFGLEYYAYPPELSRFVRGKLF